MNPVHIIGAVGKSQDAVQSIQSTPRAQMVGQEILAAELSARAEHASEQVGAAPPEDRLELSADQDGSGGSGGDGRSETDDEEADRTGEDAPGGHIDFLA